MDKNEERKGADPKEVPINKDLGDRPMSKEEISEQDTIKLIEECKAAKGYMIFALVVENEKNTHGNNLIKYRYIRKKVAYEDAYKSLRTLKDHLLQDLGINPGKTVNAD